jgi:hypothetical protein
VLCHSSLRRKRLCKKMDRMLTFGTQLRRATLTQLPEESRLTVHTSHSLSRRFRVKGDRQHTHQSRARMVIAADQYLDCFPQKLGQVIEKMFSQTFETQGKI